MVEFINIEHYLSHKQDGCNWEDANEYIEHIWVHIFNVASSLHLVLPAEHFSGEFVGKCALVVVCKWVAFIRFLIVLLWVCIFVCVTIVIVSIVIAFGVLVYIWLSLSFVQNTLELAFLDRCEGTLTGSLRILYASLISLNFYAYYGFRSGWYCLASE